MPDAEPYLLLPCHVPVNPIMIFPFIFDPPNTNANPNQPRDVVKRTHTHKQSETDSHTYPQTLLRNNHPSPRKNLLGRGRVSVLA
jgi:hypothetical protein